MSRPSSSSDGNRTKHPRLSSQSGTQPSFQPRKKHLARPAAESNATHAQGGRKAVWLDCDPGHDDAIALLMAVHHPDIDLVGVSTVAGNARGEDTFHNAIKLMGLYRASPDTIVLRGSDCPLVKQVTVDEGIHGKGGLGGVLFLPDLSSDLCKPFTEEFYSGADAVNVMTTLSMEIQDRMSTGQSPIHVAVTGPLTNIALFLRCYPHLVGGIAQIVLMGGAAGVRGNRGAIAEFNILNDPEAASIVFNTDVKVVMAGLNVTHQAIFTRQLHDRLLYPALPGVSQVRGMLSSTLTFFAKTYADEFGFTRGPPVHDMLVIAYIIDPTLFHRRVPSPGDVPNPSMFDADPHSDKGQILTPPKRYRVDVECAEGLACGATVVDFWGDRVEHEGWGKGGRNVEVLENLDCPRMWEVFFRAVEAADAHILSCQTKKSTRN